MSAYVPWGILQLTRIASRPCVRTFLPCSLRCQRRYESYKVHQPDNDEWPAILNVSLSAVSRQ